MSITMTDLYYQEDNGACYVHLDGGLRHLPNPGTMNNLFHSGIAPENCNQFKNAESAPFPILNSFPIMNNAQLVNSPAHPNGSIFLTDAYPWDRDTVVLRHVINPAQMDRIGFDWSNVVDYNGNAKVGVPLSIDSTNYQAAQHLAGFSVLYDFLILKKPFNAFFNYLMQSFPAQSSMLYKSELKSLIVKYQASVNAL